MVTVAQFVTERADELVRRWCDEASRAASSRGLDRPDLTNIMPEFIGALAHEHDLGSFGPERRRYIETHLAARIRHGFSVEEIVDELLLVGRCVKRMCEDGAPEAAVSPAEMVRLWAELDRAAAAVSDMFLRHMAEDEQEEKRYGRLLRTLAHEALVEGAPPLRERLDEALSLILEGVGAHSATLLVYRPSTGELVTVAHVGVDAMAPYVVGLERSSFAGRAASHADATVVEDVETTQLAIPEDVRRSGIRSLLGIRLPAHHTLAGVLYVGLRDPRPFTAREVRRLEALGEQLTLHLDNASLVAALKAHVQALEDERELRERFVAVLAHDLRGPLAAAKMAVSVLTTAVDTSAAATAERLRSCTTRIDRNLDRADRMVRDLLDANRIHAGKRLPVRLSSGDLVAVARATVEELDAQHHGRFVVRGDARVLGVWGEEELRRALWNLATNAVKYGAPDKPIVVCVWADGAHAYLSVHNDGAPIAEDERERLFEPFARARTAEGAGPRGWGLGLTLVRGAAEAHGGRVTVESDAANGTMFTIELPRDMRRATPASPDEPHARGAAGASRTPAE